MMYSQADWTVVRAIRRRLRGSENNGVDSSTSELLGWQLTAVEVLVVGRRTRNDPLFQAGKDADHRAGAIEAPHEQHLIKQLPQHGGLTENIWGGRPSSPI